MDFELDPPHGVGPLRIGMPRAQADSVLAQLRDSRQLSVSDSPRQHIIRSSGLMISIGCMRDRLQSVEITRPQAHIDVVRFQGVDVLGLPARVVLERLRERIPIEPFDNEPASFVARDLTLSLWRPFEADDEPDEEQGYYFRTVLVAGPGYYDTPAQAAERSRQSGSPS
jgi:hypothetical protein